MHLLYFAVTVFGNMKGTFMFSKYKYSLKANLVVDLCPVLIKKYLTCQIKRSLDAKKVQFVCQTLFLVLLNSILQYHKHYVYGVVEN